MTSPFVQSLHIYPIKSTAGITLSHSWVDDFGLSFDRRFVITDLDGQFITARTQPTLCLIQCHLSPDGLVLTAPNMPQLEINFARFSEQYHQVTVWKDQVNALYCHQIYDRWFSEYLNLPCQLHFFGEKSSRQVKNSENQVGFADGYPLLLISQASLDDLNNRMAQRQSAKGNVESNVNASMTQFRPNIVVNDTTAFAEDNWHHIKVGEVEFEITKPCSRCVFTTIDPENGQKHPEQEPLSTLKSYRQVEKGDVMFGQNLIPLNKGQVKQGDKITIIRKQPAPVFVTKNTPNLALNKAPEKNTEQIEKTENITLKKVVPKKITIQFDSWNKTHQGNTQEPILDQGEAAGLIIPYSCRGGMCGRCKIKLNNGQVKQLADDGLTDDEKAEGYVLACSSIPQSDLVLSSS